MRSAICIAPVPVRWSPSAPTQLDCPALSEAQSARRSSGCWASFARSVALWAAYMDAYVPAWRYVSQITRSTPWRRASATIASTAEPTALSLYPTATTTAPSNCPARARRVSRALAGVTPW
jgi:hypothetical protein